MYEMDESRTQVVPLTLADGKTIQVEATALGGSEDVADITKALSLEQVTDTIQGIAQSVHSTLRSINPDKATVEFGIQVALESGTLTALLVKGTGTANLKVSLEWSK